MPPPPQAVSGVSSMKGTELAIALDVAVRSEIRCGRSYNYIKSGLCGTFL